MIKHWLKKSVYFFSVHCYLFKGKKNWENNIQKNKENLYLVKIGEL